MVKGADILHAAAAVGFTNWGWEQEEGHECMANCQKSHVFYATSVAFETDVLLASEAKLPFFVAVSSVTWL